MAAPRTIPEHLVAEFTLNGQIPIYDYYFNNVVPANTIQWSALHVESFINRFTTENISNNTLGQETYNGAALLHLQAGLKYIESIKNKKVAVVGSESPWIEAILFNLGAREITTVEYNVPVCDHPAIKTISYTEFCNSPQQYDAIFSYSSIEHSGLGRYGDPLNPTGDIETMAQIYKSLQEGGMCFVGFPVGKDYLVWNAHRIYGEMRLPLLYLDKFKEIEWLGCDKSFMSTCQPSSEAPYFLQPIIVLQK